MNSSLIMQIDLPFFAVMQRLSGWVYCVGRFCYRMRFSYLKLYRNLYAPFNWIEWNKLKMRASVGVQTMGCENLTANVNNATNISQPFFLLRATMCALGWLRIATSVTIHMGDYLLNIVSHSLTCKRTASILANYTFAQFAWASRQACNRLKYTLN